MGIKRKHQNNDIQKHLPVEVVAQDVASHPLCLHGPTLLFSNPKERYFSCSLSRNKKDCTVHITEEDWELESVKKRNEKYVTLIPNINKTALQIHLKDISSEHPSNRGYCITCSELYKVSQTKKHNKDHRVVTPLTDEQLAYPSKWLPYLQNDTVEAQYIFRQKSIATVLEILRNNNIKNILCIGTPSIHEAAKSLPFNSILLDYDTRHALFNSPDKFIHYNMFNNYLFSGRSDEIILQKFLKDSRKEGICIVMDPPFGGRVEPLVQTLKDLSETYRNVNKLSGDELLPVVWAFPYFAEPYITNIAPEIKMHDYQVEYENHKKFQTQTAQGRKHGSPVRFYTNLPLHTIDLSEDSNYKLCGKCKVYVHKSNVHCNKCNSCTSKNGMTYKHCGACKRCVKPTFFHCKTCGRCCQQKGHVCGVVVESQSCYNCNEKGHKKAHCPKLNKKTGGKKRKTST